MNDADDQIPQRSADGLAALDVFYDDFNDVHFFVEDEDQENLYETLLRKVFPLLKIARIFPLGGKQAVLKQATNSNRVASAPFGAYIVDKDFDDLLATRVSAPNLFYLDRYCIENYVLDEGAIVEVIVENHPKKKRGQIAESLGLRSRISTIFADLRPLFVLFFGCQRLQLGITNCSAAPERYCSSGLRWEICQAAIENYKTEVIEAAAVADISPTVTDPLSDPRFTSALSADDHALVSGKYVCAMIHHYVKSRFSLGSMTFDSFVYRLAKNCGAAPMRELAKRIATTVASERPLLADRLQIA